MAAAEHRPLLSAVAVNGIVVAATKATTGHDDEQEEQEASLEKSRPPLLPPPPPSSARAFLLSRRRGAYTALAVSPCGGAQFWQEHCERLAATLAIMAEEEEGEEGEDERATTTTTSSSSSILPSFRTWHASSERQVPLPLASLIGEALLPSVRAAVSAVRGMQAEGEATMTATTATATTTTKTTTTTSHHSRCAGGGTVNVVVLLSEPEDSAPRRQQQHPESLPLDVAVFAWEATASSASSSPSTPFFSPRPQSAVVVGGARKRPHAKDSSWVKAREPLEAKLRAEIVDATSPGGEGLLVDAEGRLLEGLVTNVFVVVEKEKGEGGGGGGERKDDGDNSGGDDDSLPRRFELQTASVEEGVLDGVMRRAAIEAAGSVGVDVVLSAPDPGRRRRWREAFVTSALKGVNPLRGIRGEGWSVEFEEEIPGPVTRAIVGALDGVVGHYRVQL